MFIGRSSETAKHDVVSGGVCVCVSVRTKSDKLSEIGVT